MKNLVFVLAVLVTVPFSGFAAPLSPAGCPVVGIKETEQYLTASERRCFKNSTRAEAQGYEAFVAPTEPVEPALVAYRATANGTSEVPPNNSTATGTCLATHIVATAQLQILCTHNANSPSMAHIHEGAVGVDGGIVCDLGNGVSPISTTCDVTPTFQSALEAGNLYVNIHTTGFSGGEIRGQLVAE